MQAEISEKTDFNFMEYDSLVIWLRSNSIAHAQRMFTACAMHCSVFSQ
jgi:hypothetical protein